MPIYSLGSNGSGQLGIGHEEDVSAPAILHLPLEPRHTSIISIRAGGNHTLLLTSSGQVYSTGDGTSGACAFSTPQSTSFVQSDVTLTKLFAATWDASIFVSGSNNSIHVCGTGQKGELGLGPSVTNVSAPALIHNFPPQSTEIIDIAACMGHVVVVLSNGEVWGWGNGQQGQLGDPSSIVWQPRKIENIPFKAARVVCGKDFTVIFGNPDEGSFAVFGVRKRDRFNVRTNAPENVRGWIDVQATWGSIYVLKLDGSLDAWGRNDHGQLPPADLPKVTAIAAGSEHILALTAGGKVAAWGWGEHGNCGEPVDEQKDVKGRWNELEFDTQVIGIGGGCATSWIITSDER